jgi:hypothetical protein
LKSDLFVQGKIYRKISCITEDDHIARQLVLLSIGELLQRVDELRRILAPVLYFNLRQRIAFPAHISLGRMFRLYEGIRIE